MRGTLAVLLFLAFGVYQVTIKNTVSQHGGFDGMKVYSYALPAPGILLSLCVVSALNEIRRTTTDIARFRRPLPRDPAPAAPASRWPSSSSSPPKPGGVR